MSQETKEIALGGLAGLAVIAVVFAAFALVLMFYGAIFGAIGAGIYLAFKFIVGVFL